MMSDANSQRLCFVVMGFGKKTDFEAGRVFDLDATYEAIIAPAAEEFGLRCVRADDIMHSGVIDRPMFEMLLRADLVIADISTGNVNAVYELGVRHALRPKSTIVMKESQGKLSFDLNHVNTFQYEHLGADIGAREAIRAKKALVQLIEEVLAGAGPDSPVYTFLPSLQGPRLSDEQFAEFVDEAEAAQERLVAHIRAGQRAMRASRPDEAVMSFAEAVRIKPHEQYLVQQLALATYKAKLPSEVEALLRAWTLIAGLGPDETNDPETLGLAGAVRKRLHAVTGDIEQLNAAIRYYGRGFEVARDYYNGENLATLYDLRAKNQADAAEAQYDRMSARKAREAVIGLLRPLISGPSFADRSDRRWVFATLANTLLALGEDREAGRYEADFLGCQPADWERETYMQGKAAMLTSRAVDHHHA